MLTARDVKDKRIMVAGLAFVAEIHLMNGVVIPGGRHLTLRAAQKVLSKYPADVFEGFDDPSRLLSKEIRKRSPGSMRDRYQAATRQIRSEAECANWDQPYTRLYDWRC